MVEGSEHVHWTSDETAVSLSSDTSIASLESLYEDEVFDDEMEVAGFAFGTIALVGPLASACLSAYGLLKDMKSIDDDAADFRLLVDTQMGLLSLWVKTWVHFEPIVDDGATNPVSRNGRLRSGVIGSIGEDNCLLVVRILAKISKTLGDAMALQNLYGIQLTPFPIQGTARIGESSRSANNKVQVQVLPADGSSFSKRLMSSDSTDSSVQSPVSATISSNISGSRRKPGNNVRSWFSRVNCLQLCSPGKRNKPSTKQKHASITQTPNEKPQKQRNTPHASGMDTAIIDIEANPAALEAMKTEIVDNLTKIQCLRWILSDKNKGMLLAQELQHWNDNLFKILPLKRIETPAKIRTGRHYTMPQSSPIFTGRAVALKMLEDIFFSNEPQPRQRRAVIHGLGGAGKTQIVLKFAEEHLDRFDSIFWIDASSDNTVEDSFREIAEHLKVTGRHLTTAVKHRLSSIYDYNYLLIFDNADNLPSLSTYFPGGKHGNILVTSRNPRTRDIVSDQDKHTFEVDKMSHSDAYEFLLKAARLSPEEVARPATEKSARLIIEKLGYLALAIDQAGAYIANTCSIQDYLAIYDTMRPILMSTREFQGSGYAASVYQTWELSLEAVEQKNPAAAELLKVLGYFHYEGIPREIFEAGSLVFARASRTVGNRSLSPLGNLLAECIRCDSATKNNSTGGWVAYPFDQTIKILCSYSLVKRHFTSDGTGSPSYTIHPLVHCWIRDRSEPNVLQRQRAQSIAIALLQEAMLRDDKEGGYVLRNQLVSHLDAWIRPYLDTDTISDPNWVTGHSEEEHIAVLEAAAETYHDAGRLDDAEELRERVLRWRVENLGVTDPDTARARIKLAMTYRRKGYVQKAVHLDKETLQHFIHSDDKGPENDETLEAMLNLAWSYAEAGMVSEAEQLERQVITVRTKLLGPDSIEVAMARGNLGVTLWRMGRFEEAEEELQVALEHKVAVYGRDNPSTLLTIGNLASAIRGQKRWKSAENLGREVVEVRKQRLGEKHQDVARGVAHIGVTYLEAGRAEEALDIQVDSLEALRETVGDYHPHTLDTMENLSRVFIHLGREEEAAETLGDLVGKRKMVLGETHPITLKTMKMLGELQGHEGVLDEVREIEAKEAERKKSVATIKDPEIHDLEEDGVKKEVDNEIHRERKQRREELVATGISPDRWNVLLECPQAPVVEAS